MAPSDKLQAILEHYNNKKTRLKTARYTIISCIFRITFDFSDSKHTYVYVNVSSSALKLYRRQFAPALGADNIRISEKKANQM